MIYEEFKIKKIVCRLRKNGKLNGVEGRTCKIPDGLSEQESYSTTPQEAEINKRIFERSRIALQQMGMGIRTFNNHCILDATPNIRLEVGQLYHRKGYSILEIVPVEKENGKILGVELDDRLEDMLTEARSWFNRSAILQNPVRFIKVTPYNLVLTIDKQVYNIITDNQKRTDISGAWLLPYQKI